MAETVPSKRATVDDGKEAKKQVTEMEKMMLKMEAMMKEQHESLEQKLTEKMDTSSHHGAPRAGQEDRSRSLRDRDRRSDNRKSQRSHPEGRGA